MFAVNVSKLVSYGFRSTTLKFAATKSSCQCLTFDASKRTLFVGYRQPVFRSTLLFSGKPIVRSLRRSVVSKGFLQNTKARWQTLKENNPRWFISRYPKLRLLFRFTRVSIMLIAFGSICMSIGRITLLDNPEEYYQATLKELLVGGNVNNFVVVHENVPLNAEAKKKGAPFTHSIDEDGVVQEHVAQHDDTIWLGAQIAQRVFENIKKGAVKVSEEIYQASLDEFEQIPKDDMSKAEIQELRAEMLGDITVRLQKLKQPWSVVVTDDPVPNAFVIGLLPRYVFVTQGLFEEFAHNEHELAMVLGHELSHYLLGHTRDGVIETALVKGAVIAAISVVDVSGGLGSLALELLLPLMGQALEKKYSRTHEHEADACGLQIVGASCYDPDQAIHMFERMRKFEELHGVGNGLRMLGTHPDPGGRLNSVTELVEEAMGVLSQSECYQTEVQVGNFYSTLKEVFGGEEIEKEVELLQREVWDWGLSHAGKDKDGYWVQAVDGQGKHYWWHTKTRESTRTPKTAAERGKID